MAAEETTSSPPETTVIGTDSAQRNAKPEEAQTLVPVSHEGGIIQLHLSQTLIEISRINSEAAMRLLRSYASKLESDLHEMKNERDAFQEKSEKWMKDYYDERERCAVLRAAISKKNLQNFVGAFGALIAGIAIPILIAGQIGWGLGSSIIGLSLLVVGFWPSEFKETKEPNK